MFSNHITQKLKTLPNKPGVYLFKNRQGNVLYVGKAKVLKNRVVTYFRPKAELSEAKQIMVQQIVELDWIEVLSEADALVLEDRLIKDYQPRFNILAKDDKSFLYIYITAEDFPRVMAVRRPDLREPGTYYGPYPFARSIREVLKLLHKVFPFRTCGTLPHKACLEYYLGNCKAPCIGNISKPDYQAMIDYVIDLFEDKATDFIGLLDAEMKQAAEHQLFERAAKARDQLQSLRKLQALRKTPQHYIAEYYKTKNLDPQQGLVKLAEALGIAKPLHRIEVYDISNFQGEYSVASMIVFIDGLPDKREYRRFKIKTVIGPNDFKSMQEVVQRRLKRAWPLPDLAIMDGGKGQLSSVAEFWQHAGVAVSSLAKQREELFLPSYAKAPAGKPNNPLPILLPQGSQELFLVQRMRDEAHRFAITYYRLLHTKAMRAANL